MWPTAAAACAALGEGGSPPGSMRSQRPVETLMMCTSEVAPASRIPLEGAPPGDAGATPGEEAASSGLPPLPPSRAVAPPIRMRMSGGRSGADESAVSVCPQRGPGRFCGLEGFFAATRKDLGLGAPASAAPACRKPTSLSGLCCDTPPLLPPCSTFAIETWGSQLKGARRSLSLLLSLKNLLSDLPFSCPREKANVPLCLRESVLGALQSRPCESESTGPPFPASAHRLSIARL
mmetsp:Transcript_40337/g.86061  ORF Transcript_40337/g.86061 Transcript_40337/m.86061 type:complete len:235 (-) Transcript_40337:204-908(-)